MDLPALRETKDRAMGHLTLDDLIDQFVEDLEFDTLVIWAEILEVEVNYPPIDDMWPDWENELRREVAKAMANVGKK